MEATYRRFAQLEVRDGRLVCPGPISADEVLVIDVDRNTGQLLEAWIEPAPTPVPTAPAPFQPE